MSVRSGFLLNFFSNARTKFLFHQIKRCGSLRSFFLLHFVFNIFTSNLYAGLTSSCLLMFVRFSTVLFHTHKGPIAWSSSSSILSSMSSLSVIWALLIIFSIVESEILFNPISRTKLVLIMPMLRQRLAAAIYDGLYTRKQE